MNQKQTQKPKPDLGPSPVCRKRAYRIPQACEAYGRDMGVAPFSHL